MLQSLPLQGPQSYLAAAPRWTRPRQLVVPMASILSPDAQWVEGERG
jgi:hypothetical protein